LPASALCARHALARAYAASMKHLTNAAWRYIVKSGGVAEAWLCGDINRYGGVNRDGLSIDGMW